MKHLIVLAIAACLSAVPAMAQQPATSGEQTRNAAFLAEKERALEQLTELRDELQHSVASWGREMGASSATRQEVLQRAQAAADAELTNIEMAIKRAELAGSGDWPAVKDLVDQTLEKGQEALKRLADQTKS
jgi:hypothetical protein